MFSSSTTSERAFNIRAYSQDPYGMSKRTKYMESVLRDMNTRELSDFSAENFGIDLYENNKETHVKADYGIMYSRTDIVDLRGNVFITTPEGAVLNTSQLYWDIKKEWVFTQEYFTFKNEDYDIAANILDASRSFDKITTGPLVGNVLVEEEEL